MLKPRFHQLFLSQMDPMTDIYYQILINHFIGTTYTKLLLNASFLVTGTEKTYPRRFLIVYVYTIWNR
jgi:hypothetical protein